VSRSLFFAAVVTVFSLSSVVSVLLPEADAGASSAYVRPDASTFEVQLGPEQKLSGPNGEIDTPFFSERNAAGNLVGFSGNGTSYEFDTQGNTKLLNGRAVVPMGARGTIDGCGAWLSSIYKVPQNGKPSAHWVGWYHAEAPGAGQNGTCSYADASTVWRVAQVVSWNSGRTWTKASYPNNVVLTQDTALTAPITQDAGNPRVIAVGSYLYMYYQAATRDSDLRQLNIARAPLSSLGAPGSWKKYFCGSLSCGFTEPGIGGRSTGLKNIAPSSRYVVWNSYLGRFIAPQASGRAGFALRVAAAVPSGQAALDWPSAATIYPEVSTVDDPRVDLWGSGRTSSSRSLYAYPSLLGANGESATTGQSFYLYYMKIFPGDGFSKRNLFRRKVSLVKVGSAYPINRVQLTTYVDAKGHRRTTTEQPKAAGYRIQTSVGYLGTAGGYLSGKGWHDVFECPAPHGDAYLRVAGCPTGITPVRRVGWISPTRTALAKVTIYKCWDKKTARHFNSTSSTCSGKRRQGVLGYGLPAIA
jgi:hypothetical protein